MSCSNVLRRRFREGMFITLAYQTTLKRTDAYYDRNRQTVKLLEDNRAEAKKNFKATSQGKELEDPYSRYPAFVRAFVNRQSDPREYITTTDYSLDGTGFYLKQDSSYIDSKGVGGKDGPTIFVSNGKLMGTFYSDAQAVIQPATERPQRVERDWDEIAYYCFKEKLSSMMMDGISDFSTSDDGKEIVILAKLPLEGLQRSQLELRIDKATLLPEKMTCDGYDHLGKLFRKSVKTWQFQNFSGISMPKNTVEEYYRADMQGKMQLEETETFTINEFSPQVQSSEERLKALLKSNYSVYDEITGSHYVSGDPESILNTLSK